MDEMFMWMLMECYIDLRERLLEDMSGGGGGGGGNLYVACAFTGGGGSPWR